LVGLEGFHVIGVDRGPDLLTVRVESAPGPVGCPACGVVASSRGRRARRLVDTPCFGTPVVLVWVKRTWACPEPACPTKTFSEIDESLAPPRSTWTTRARWWAVEQMRTEHACVAGLARQLGVAWDTTWAGIKPLLDAAAADETRFAGVHTLGVDEHIWHHVSEKIRGPKALTGMVDLTRDEHGNVQARLLDLVPGRSGKAYMDWLTARSQAFRAGVQVATLDPFHGYKNAIDEELEDATAVLDAFHVVKLGTQAVDEVRRRVQQQIHGHRGRKGDPLYGIRNILHARTENLTDRQQARLTTAFAADPRHEEVSLAWQCAQKLRSVYHADTTTEGQGIAQQIIDTFPTCPIPEIARLGKTLKRWAQAFLAYFTTGRASNGGTEAINGLIELHRRIARGFRNRENYRLRMLLIAGGLNL
jgi:transposase